MFANSSPSRRRAFSLPEILTVIAVIGVLAAIAIPAYTNITRSAQDAEASDFVESLNRAVLRFAQANWDIPTPADNASTADELTVLLSIQFKWADKAAGREIRLGSPYFSQRYRPAVSNNSTVHRLRWTGRGFEVLLPGQPGSGLLKTFDGKDQTNAVFPVNFLPAGTPAGYTP